MASPRLPPQQLVSRKEPSSSGRCVRTTDAAATGSVGSGWMDMPESQPLPEAPLEVFPRRRESDPYKLLGVAREGDFEEVQDARNFLVEQYKAHEPSREAIELAYEKVLAEHMKRRKEGGFRPPQKGRRGDVRGDAPVSLEGEFPALLLLQGVGWVSMGLCFLNSFVGGAGRGALWGIVSLKLSLWQQLLDKFEPSVPGTTIVNDGSIFLALGLWAGWQVRAWYAAASSAVGPKPQRCCSIVDASPLGALCLQAASSDPTLPLGAAICYCAYKLYDKRSRRMGTDDPDRTPIWGALGSTILALVLGGVVSYVIVSVTPLPPRVSSEGLGSLLITLSLGFAALFLK
ncbi:hypothetical protein N2152v2_003238 [Parachlorella kessleri]